jgi:hypothetical protein
VSARLTTIVVTLAAAGGLLSAGAHGAVPAVTDLKVGPAVKLTVDGKAIWVPLQFQCAVGQALNLKTLVFQTGGALAPGDYQATCTGKVQHGAFKVTPRGKTPHLFKAGSARACWLRTLRKVRSYTDVESACNTLTIAKAS